MELYLHQNGEQVGPYTEDQISSMLASGGLSQNDIVWHEGLTEWQPIHVVFSLSAAIAPRLQSNALVGRVAELGSFG